jgi:SPP1 family predicted phage head-tail adaptor
MSVKRQLFKNLASDFVSKTFADFAQPFTIEAKVNTLDGQGGSTVTWTTFATTTGFVKKAGGGEIVETTQGLTKIDNNDTYEFSFQFIDDITEDMRVVFGGQVFNIQSVDALLKVDVWSKVVARRGDPT